MLVSEDGIVCCGHFSQNIIEAWQIDKHKMVQKYLEVNPHFSNK
jgi:hypothetical protein